MGFLTRRQMMLWSLGILSASGVYAASNNRKTLSVADGATLRERASRKNLLYGSAVQHRLLTSDRAFADVFVKECGILVPERELKWDTLRPSPDQFNFELGDALLEFAQRHNLLMRGHTLVWHEALPAWFPGTVNRRNAEQVLLKHIQTVVGHYAGKLHSWDVVNEAILPSDKRSDGLRNTPWLKMLGSNYIDLAFRAAASADPKAMLVYNDHWLDYDTYEGKTRRAAVLKLLERLKSQGTPIHALGIQAHLHRDEPRLNAQQLSTFLRQVAQLDLKILITELDVTDKKLPQDLVPRDRIVANAYEDYLNVVLAEPAVIAVLTWGLSDRYTWLAKYDPRPDGSPPRPLPLDAQLNRKLAWNAIASAFDQAPQRKSKF